MAAAGGRRAGRLRARCGGDSAEPPSQSEYCELDELSVLLGECELSESHSSALECLVREEREERDVRDERDRDERDDWEPDRRTDSSDVSALSSATSGGSSSKRICNV